MDDILASTVETQFSTAKFIAAREKGLFTDIELLVGTGDSCQIFKAHCVFLACGSPVFEDMLQRYLCDEMNFMPVQIPDVQPHIFKSFIDHLYGVKIGFTSVHMATEIYKVADKYSVRDLRDQSELYVCNFINVKQVLSLLQVADSNFMPILKLKCLDFIASFLGIIMNHELFDRITEKNFEMILQRKNIKASQLNVLRAIARWEIANKLYDQERQWKAPLVKYVRFSELSVIDFCDFTTEYPSIISPSDALKIVKYLRCPSKYKLPEWCIGAESVMPNDDVATSLLNINNSSS